MSCLRLDVAPRPALYDRLNAARRDSELLCQSIPSTLSFCVESTYKKYFLSSEFYVVVAFAFRQSSFHGFSQILAFCSSSLHRAVSHIVGVGTCEEMRWIDARRVIALVENVERYISASMAHTPTDTVSQECSACIPTPKVKFSISRGVGICHPYPAVIRAGNFHFCPKAYEVQAIPFENWTVIHA